MPKRDEDARKAVKWGNQRRLCEVTIEDITHIIPVVRKYREVLVPLNCDFVARILFSEIRPKGNSEHKEIRNYSVVEAIATYNKNEYWSNVPGKNQ